MATRARYAHLAADPVKAAAEQVSSEIAKAVLGEQRDRVAASGYHRESPMEEPRGAIESSCYRMNELTKRTMSCLPL